MNVEIQTLLKSSEKCLHGKAVKMCAELMSKRGKISNIDNVSINVDNKIEQTFLNFFKIRTYYITTLNVLGDFYCDEKYLFIFSTTSTVMK